MLGYSLACYQQRGIGKGVQSAPLCCELGSLMQVLIMRLRPFNPYIFFHSDRAECIHNSFTLLSLRFMFCADNAVSNSSSWAAGLLARKARMTFRFS